MLVCANCGNDFDLRPGRGRQSPFCEECKPKLRNRKVAQRQIRHALAQMYEWVDALAPDIIAQKEVLNDRQSGRCFDCGRRRKLYFARADGALVGVCLADLERRRLTVRRGR